MVDIPENLKEYGFEVETPKDVEKTVLNSLQLLKQQAGKILDAYDDYCTADSDRLKDTYDMIKRVGNFGNGFKELAEEIEKYCQKHISEIELHKDLKKELKRTTK